MSNGEKRKGFDWTNADPNKLRGDEVKTFDAYKTAVDDKQSKANIDAARENFLAVLKKRNKKVPAGKEITAQYNLGKLLIGFKAVSKGKREAVDIDELLGE
jgi:hypothetical protein